MTAARTKTAAPASKLGKIVATAAMIACGMAAFAPSEASAQEIQMTGPLKGAPAVRSLRLYREGRIELAPTLSFTFLDEYRRTMFAGLRVQYNIKDWIGVGVWGAYGVVSLTTDLTDKINDNTIRSTRTGANVAPKEFEGGDGFKAQTAKMQWIAAPQIQLVPFRGKLALFQKLFVDADAYLHVGAAFVGVQERADCSKSGSVSTITSCTDPRSFELTSRVAIAPTFGLGLTFYASSIVSIGAEYRAFPFAWNRAGFDSRGSGADGRFPDGQVDSQDRTFRFNQMVSISLGLFPQKRTTSF